MSETWLSVRGFEGLYEVSDRGRVRSIAGGRRLGTIRNTSPSRGYPRVTLYRNGQHTRTVHRLVAEAFLGPCPEGMEAAHLNGIRTDNRAENIIWTTRTENHGHKALHGTAQRGERNPHAKLTEAAVRAIRARRALGETLGNIAESYGISARAVSDIANRRRWAHVA